MQFVANINIVFGITKNTIRMNQPVYVFFKSQTIKRPLVEKPFNSFYKQA